MKEYYFSLLLYRWVFFYRPSENVFMQFKVDSLVSGTFLHQPGVFCHAKVINFFVRDFGVARLTIFPLIIAENMF